MKTLYRLILILSLLSLPAHGGWSVIQRISVLSDGFTGTVEDGDKFGISVTPTSDLDNMA